MTWRRLLHRQFAGAPSSDAPGIRRGFVDPLTGCTARHVLTDCLRSARREGLKGALLLFDVDLLKHFNERHGRDVGDILLGQLATRLRECLPASAAPARTGSDEFGVFLPGMAAADALRLARRCLDRAREPIALTHAATEIVTLSAAVATFNGQTVDDALKSCELALYAAKARGRDRVVLYDDDARRIVSERRELGASVVELQERSRALREEARTDPLTGLRNRLALDEALELVVGAGDRRLHTAAVAFVDVDHFGNYNHVHGDARGDDALRAVAEAIKACAREGDYVYRKGGEEFVVVLAGAEKAAALAAAERIREAVEALALPHAGSAAAPVVTVTVGVASGAPGYTLRQLLNAAAEQAMSGKLENARNQVHGVRLRGVGVVGDASEATSTVPGFLGPPLGQPR